MTTLKWQQAVSGLGSALRCAVSNVGTSQPTPWAMSFLVTARCGLRCKHCFYHYFKSTARDELTLDEYRRLSAGLGPFPVALFCGGEPFLRPDLGEIITLFRRNNGVHLASATTNGQHQRSVVTQVEAILADEPHKPFMLGISLEGRREVHDAIRGEGSFDKAVATFHACRELRSRYPNLSLTATTVVSTLNQHHAADFVRWAARELEPNSHCVLLVRQSPRDGEAMKEVDIAHYEEAQREAVAAMRRGPWHQRLRPDALYLEAVARHVAHTHRTGVRSFHCHAGRHGALIDPIGRVQVCEALAEVPSIGHIGTLRDHDMDFHALWRTLEAERARAMVNRAAPCRGCTHETMGHATSLPFPPNWLWRLRHDDGPSALDDDDAQDPAHPGPVPELVQVRRGP